jgi:hypothetical protein
VVPSAGDSRGDETLPPPSLLQLLSLAAATGRSRRAKPGRCWRRGLLSTRRNPLPGGAGGLAAVHGGVLNLGDGGAGWRPTAEAAARLEVACSWRRSCGGTAGSWRPGSDGPDLGPAGPSGPRRVGLLTPTASPVCSWWWCSAEQEGSSGDAYVQQLGGGDFTGLIWAGWA